MTCVPSLFISEGKMDPILWYPTNDIFFRSGPHHGHYVAVVKNNTQWILLDDEDVHVRFLFSSFSILSIFANNNMGM